MYVLESGLKWTGGPKNGGTENRQTEILNLTPVPHLSNL